MKGLYKTSLRRSWLNFSVIASLFMLCFIQVALYFYFKQAELIKNPLLDVGYLIGVIGFIGAILGVLFTSAGQYTAEMGNFETIGYKRSRYILFYLKQYFLVACASLLVAACLFLLVYAIMSEFAPIDNGVLAQLLIFTFILLTIILNGFTGLFFFIRSRPDPLLLVKDK